MHKGHPLLRARSLGHAFTGGIAIAQQAIETFMKRLTQVTIENFERDVLASAAPVLVTFYKPQCEHCQAIAPMLESLANDFVERIKFVAVDIDRDPALAARHMIGEVPTLRLFKDGTDLDIDIDCSSRRTLKWQLESIAVFNRRHASHSTAA